MLVGLVRTHRILSRRSLCESPRVVACGRRRLIGSVGVSSGTSSGPRAALRILHVVQGYAPAAGGTERVVQRLSEVLVRDFGDEVTVFTTDCRGVGDFVRSSGARLPVGWEEIAGVRVRRFAVSRWPGRLLEYPARLSFRFGAAASQHLRTLYAGPVVPGLVRAIRRQPADLVVATSFPLLHMYSALRAARRSARPCVLVGGLHPGDRWGFDRPMIYDAIRRADHYVAYTPFEAHWVEAQGMPSERISTIGPGVDAHLFESVDRTRARQSLGLDDGLVIGFVGQLAPHKGIDRLLEAMPTVWAAHPGAGLLIAGAPTPHVEELRRHIARLEEGFRQKVRLIEGFMEDQKPSLLAACDLLVYPSRYESFGLVFLEAWASGIPVIGCRGGAVEDVIREGVDGLLVRPDSAPEIAAAIVRLLANPAERASLGEQGRARVRAHHRWETVAARFREAYLRAVEDSAATGEIHA